MLTWLAQICCMNIIPYEHQKIKEYLQPQLISPVCLQTFHPTQPILIREDVMHVDGECRIQLQFSVLIENFNFLVTKFGFAKLKKKKTPQEKYLPAIHKPSYIRIPPVNNNIFGFTTNYTTYVEEYTSNPKRIHHVSIISPVIFNIFHLKMYTANFLMFLEFQPHDIPDDFAFQFCAITENDGMGLVTKIVKHVYSRPFKIVPGPCNSLKLIYVDQNEYHLGTQ